MTIPFLSQKDKQDEKTGNNFQSKARSKKRKKGKKSLNFDKKDMKILFFYFGAKGVLGFQCKMIKSKKKLKKGNTLVLAA